jgi:hypothetical protein
VEIASENAVCKPRAAFSCAFRRCAILAEAQEREIRIMRAEENWKELEQKFSAAVKLGKRPVAVAFLDAKTVQVSEELT